MTIQKRHEAELNRLYDVLNTLEPGTDEYNSVLTQIMNAREGEVEMTKVEDARKAAKIDTIIKIGTFAAGVVLVPVVDLLCKRSLTKYIGTIEQMETFTSTPSRSMSSWFTWKK